MVLTTTSADGESLHSTFASRYVRTSLPRFRLPDSSTPKEAAYQIISDELMLDGNPRLNLASFVTTWMEPECDRLILSAINKNYVDMDEYPVTTELQVKLPLINPFIFGNLEDLGTLWLFSLEKSGRPEMLILYFETILQKKLWL
ncbi:glutamate decarboxylase-like [Phalaenopsis equestris]|uniref:glutamate decarboxylase-like n=1 Tax=Phalaenopsis equestris TaxID=78828 RepID=UPI0009E2F0B4|nr:glutamate decarboxylase-like [Phalaenopsis equestris]